MVFCWRAVTTTLLLVGLRVTHAEEIQPGLFGDWGGLRSALTAHGVDLELSYIDEFATNASGGTSRESANANQFYFGGSLDLHQLLGLAGSKLVFSFTDRNGESLSNKPGLNTLLEVQEIYGEGNWAMLNQLYWEQEVGNRVLLKFGRITGTFDFMPFSCYFQNNTFCHTLPSHNVAENWIAFPGGTWAGIARFALSKDKDWYLQFGGYEVDPAFQQSKYRFALGTPFAGSGTRENVEIGWLPLSAGKDGGYRIGAWYDNVGGNDLYLNTADEPLATYGGTPLPRHEQRGFYAMAQQRVWSHQDSENKSISLFANFVQADQRIAEIQQIAEVGLFWTGPISWRPQDDLGVGIGRVHVNSLIAEGARLYNSEVALASALPARPVPGNENATELYYSVNVTPAITVRPNIQFIRAPDGIHEAGDELVLGLHLSIEF
jgi:porin